MRVLTGNLGKELLALLGDWSMGRVDIATAWATEGSGLDALEDCKERRKGLRVRTLAGISGNHTTPGALKRLAKLGTVRLVNDGTGLFHVKLVLFRGSRKPLAWVGSANFTGPGFDGNEELIYETEEVQDLAKWFDCRWEAVGPQHDQPGKYCNEWTSPDVPMHGVATQRRDRSRRSSPNVRSGGVNSEPAIIAFFQEGVRPTPFTGEGTKRQSPRGEVTIGNGRYPYNSAVECLKIVLDELQQRDSRFLQRCSTDACFKRGESRYIARTALGLGSLNRSPKQLNNGWYLGVGGAQTQEKWKLILAAARIAGFSVKVVGTVWQAETKTEAAEVGF